MSGLKAMTSASPSSSSSLYNALCEFTQEPAAEPALLAKPVNVMTSASPSTVSSSSSLFAEDPELFVPQSAPTASTILLPAAAKSAVTDVKSRYLLCGPMIVFVYFDRWVKVTEDPASDLRFSLFYFITWLHCLGLLLRVLVVLGLNATLKFIRPSSSSSSLLLPSSHFYGKLKL